MKHCKKCGREIVLHDRAEALDMNMKTVTLKKGSSQGWECLLVPHIDENGRGTRRPDHEEYNKRLKKYRKDRAKRLKKVAKIDEPLNV